jgi:hypothetical protein
MPANFTRIPTMERELKKYLAARFEEERLKSIKKTTNWNFNHSDQMKDLLRGGNDKLKFRYGDKVE